MRHAERHEMFTISGNKQICMEIREVRLLFDHNTNSNKCDNADILHYENCQFYTIVDVKKL
jgi:hypothetical protein